ncbi:hypothetical protein BDK51DRAFT_26122 [Blyttiomyces helicus]|uniref:Uncharacterized protein n=1 Tax=Blyttiomyces helicus TaxID=388810 RepID=A0A4P9W8U5_9FUNG|nr:hypothetical protein BDK51DRAFT_26122 [Blyttiomyces helicus]|eukprot:RKO88794.1 hypothetical protein BDK51DRAFT_26122 [Blyttiomyces helicus]
MFHISLSTTTKQTLPPDASYLIPDSAMEDEKDEEDKEDKAGPRGDALPGAAGNASKDGEYAQDDELEDEQEDKQEFEGAIEEVSWDENSAEDNYYQEYSKGSSSVVAVKKVKAKTVPITPGKLLRDHIQGLGAACATLFASRRGVCPMSLLREKLKSRSCLRTGSAHLPPPPPQLPPPSAVRLLLLRSALEFWGKGVICNGVAPADAYAISNQDLPKLPLQGIFQFGLVFAHTRAVVLQKQTILNSSATNVPSGGNRYYIKASTANSTKIEVQGQEVKT